MKPTPIRTKIRGRSNDAGTATSAKSDAEALGKKNIEMVATSSRALYRISERDFTRSEYLSDTMSRIAQKNITINTPMTSILAMLSVEKKLNSLGVNVEV